MSSRPDNHAHKKRPPPTPPGASPPHQRRCKPSSERSEASVNTPETAGPKWVDILHPPVMEAFSKVADDPFLTPRHLVGVIAHPAHALFNTILDHPDAFTSDEWVTTLEDLSGVLSRGIHVIEQALRPPHLTGLVPDAPLPTPEHSSTSTDILAAISDLRSSLEARLTKLESHTSQTRPANPPAPTSQSKTYAAAADKPAPPPSPPLPSPKLARIPARPEGPTQHAPPRAPIRYVISYQGDPPPREARLPPQVLLSLIQAILDGSPSGSRVKFLGSHWNRPGNLILAFSPDSPLPAVDSILPNIRTALTLAPETPVTRVVPWSRLVVSSTPARPSPEALVYSSDSILESLVSSNPVFGDITVTRKPEWVRKPELIQSASSFVFSFQDPDGTIARQLLKRHIYLFGAAVAVKRWTNKPRPGG